MPPATPAPRKTAVQYVAVEVGIVAAQKYGTQTLSGQHYFRYSSSPDVLRPVSRIATAGRHEPAPQMNPAKPSHRIHLHPRRQFVLSCGGGR